MGQFMALALGSIEIETSSRHINIIVSSDMTHEAIEVIANDTDRIAVRDSLQAANGVPFDYELREGNLELRRAETHDEELGGDWVLIADALDGNDAVKVGLLDDERIGLGRMFADASVGSW